VTLPWNPEADLQRAVVFNALVLVLGLRTIAIIHSLAPMELTESRSPRAKRQTILVGEALN